MILRKGWYSRLKRMRQATAANDSQPHVVLDFYAVALEAQTEHGTYYVDRVSSDYSARFRPKLWHQGERDIAIDALDGGERIDWPSRGCAEAACLMHARLMDQGHGVHRACELVAERSQRVAEHQREPTREYAAVRA